MWDRVCLVLYRGRSAAAPAFKCVPGDLCEAREQQRAQQLPVPLAVEPLLTARASSLASSGASGNGNPTMTLVDCRDMH